MNGRRKGLEAEREAVRKLRAAVGRGGRVHHVKRERERTGPDVDAVIVVAGGLEAVEVQIKAEDSLSIGAARRDYVGVRRVLMVRRARRWYVHAQWGPGEPIGVYSVTAYARRLVGCPF